MAATTTNSNATISIHPITLDDLLTLEHIHYAAFQPSLPSLWLHPPTPADFASLAAERAQAFTNPANRWYKAVATFSPTDASDDDTTTTRPPETVGIATWKFYLADRTPTELESSLTNSWNEAQPCVNVPARREFSEGSLDPPRREVMGTRAVALLGTLTVLPAWQGRGIGGKLLSWGLAEADRSGLRAYLESSPGAVGLYARHGFEAIKQYTFDQRPYGYDVVNVETAMIRPARTPAAEAPNGQE